MPDSARMTDARTDADAGTLADQAVLAATTAQADVLQLHAPTERMLALLRDIRTVLLSTDPAALRRSVGLFGRLLGNDIDLAAEADQLREQAGVLVQQARGILQQSQQYLDAMHRHIVSMEQAQTRLQHAHAALAQAVPSDGHAPPSRRADHLLQLLATTDLSARQLRISAHHHARLHARFGMMADTLLPLLTHTAIIEKAQHGAPVHRQTLGELDALESLIITESTQEPP